MEPKLIRKDIKYQKKTLIIVSVLVISLFIGGSFALLSSSSETEEVVTFKTGNFNLEVKTEGILSLEGEVPKSYDDGFKNNDITLTLTNTGSLEIGKYDVKLEGDTTSTLESNYIRYSVSDDEGKTYLASKLLSEANNIIYTGYNLKTTKVLKVKLWIDEAAGANALKKTYNGKINVELYQNEDTVVDVVKSKLVSNYSGRNESFSGGVVAVNNDGNLYHEKNSETIREYRYSGPNVNNYVTFNDEPWRIIGVFSEGDEEFVKIVRNELIKGTDFPSKYQVNETSFNIHETSSGDGAYWNSTKTGANINDWTTAGLMYWLNSKGTDSVENGYFNKISSPYKDMIYEAKWYLGNIYINTDANDTITIVDDPITAYEHERGSNSCSNSCSGGDVRNGNQSTWIGKIGLMYPSDMGFSTDIKYWNSNMHNWNSTQLNTTWLKEGHIANEWFLSPSSNNEVRIVWWHVTGLVGHRGANYNYSYGSSVVARPSLYLKSNVKITSGDGTSTNPYKLILE